MKTESFPQPSDSASALARSIEPPLGCPGHSERGHRNLWARQASAIAWIVLAAVVGSLVVEVSASGAEPRQASMMDRWQQQETEFAIVHSGIYDFDRIQRESELRPVFQAVVARAQSDAIARSRRREMIAQREAKAATDFAALQARLPDMIQQVTHTFQEWIRPVYVAESQSGSTSQSPSAEASEQAKPPQSIQNRSSVVDAGGGTATQVATKIVATERVVNEPEPSLKDLVLKAPKPTLIRPVIQPKVVPQESVVDVRRSATPAIDEDVIIKTPQDIPIEEIGRQEIVRQDIVKREIITREITAEDPAGQETAAEAIAAREAVAEETVAQETIAEKTDQTPPFPRVAGRWPLLGGTPEITSTPGNGVSLNVDQAEVRSVLEMLARGYKMNILVAPDVTGTVTANVEGLTPEQTLEGIVKMCKLNIQRDENLIYIYAETKLPTGTRQLQVFPLDFARAESLEPTVQGLLSPSGSAFVNTLNSEDNRQAQESLVVVDIPEVIAQVERFILMSDRAPRQVLIEANILEIELADDMVHGVNFGALLSGDVTVGSIGLADPIVNRSNPLFFAQIDGTRIGALIDLLETTTDSKTLASPRVQVINGQHARIQVGQQLGFTVATVTQTSTVQDVQFLETGVVLNVTPTISRDNRIMMLVKPEVSDGTINPDTLLPEEETREVETSVILDDHQGVIIGGLIQEKDSTIIRKLPWLGDVKHIGKLFQRREAIRQRTEIVVALTCHIIEPCVQDERDAIHLQQTSEPLFHGVLQRNCRPWEPRMPDRVGAEQHMDVNKLNQNLP